MGFYLSYFTAGTIFELHDYDASAMQADFYEYPGG